EDPFGGLFAQLLGQSHRAVGTFAAGRINYLGVPDQEELTPLGRYVGRQQALQVIAAQTAHHRERNARVARGRLEQDLIGLARYQETVAFGRFDEAQRDPVFHRSGGIAALELGDNRDVRLGRERADVDYRR